MRKKIPMEEVVETMRKAIEVKIQSSNIGQGRSRSDQGQNTFAISFEGEEARTVMMVANKLTSLFIEENLKVREYQAEGTSDFLSKELQAMEERLKQKEQSIRNFRERSMGQLPQQLDANLRILERLQQQLQTTSEHLRAAEDRSVLLQSQIDQLKMRTQISTPRSPRREQGPVVEDRRRESTSEDPLVTQLNNMKRDLESAQSKYKETHPDIIDLKRKIANLEPKVKEIVEKRETERKSALPDRTKEVTEEELPPPTPDPNTERLFTQYTEQYNNALLEAKRAKEEVKNLKEQLVLYQRRIEDTPKREQELVLLTRDYDLLKANYQSLSDKKVQAQLAENLERKQQGEQFKILDPARLPEKPIRPDRNRILLIGAVIGLALGLGLTWFRESLDRSFKTVADLETTLGIPVLATIPNLKEEIKEERKAA
jgi:polysaccharide chain length determinant protein (PEP-CTERM system associated)